MNISAGHWHIGTGSVGFIDEVKEARKVAEQVALILQNNGVQVRLIIDNSSKNQQENLAYLIKEHKSIKGLNVSIHFNAVNKATESGIGTEVLYNNEQLRQLAKNISTAISKASGLDNRGAKKRTDLAFLNALQESLIIEVCFVNSFIDVAKYQKNFNEVCQAIARELQKTVKPKLAISSPALLERIESILQSEKLMEAVLEKGVQNGVFKSIWLDRLREQQLTPNDFLALCTLVATSDINK